MSAMTSGRNWGILFGVVWALGFDIQEIHPNVWRKRICAGLPKTDYAGRKQQNIEQAQRLFPQVNLVQPRCRKPHSGCADALLIASYAQSVHGR